MPTKYGEESRALLMSGIDQLAHAVGVTLGPKGRNVCIQKLFGDPLITKDGVSVAKEVSLPDPWENMGAQLLMEAASKTSDDAGDGTTSATVLAHYLCKKGNALVSAGLAPVPLKRGMDLALAAVVEGVYEMAIPVQGEKDIENVATISANGDRELGKIVAGAVSKVGRDGVVNIEEGKAAHIEVDAVDGMTFDRGWVRPEFSTNGADIVYDEPFILVTDYKISAIRPLLPLLEAVLNTGEGRALVVIAPDFEGEAIPTFLQNFRQGGLKSVLVKAPGFGIHQPAILQDIAALTGATYIAKDKGMTFESVFSDGDPVAWLGSAARVRVTAKDTTILDGDGTEDEIEGRITQIKAELERTSSEYDSDKLRDRLGKLQGGVCVIKVGAASEVEMKELKARMEDALYATRASIDDGMVAGGGSTLIKVAQNIPVPTDLGVEETAGFKLVLQACEAPLRRIVENAGENGAVWVDRVRGAEDFWGVDATDMTLKNMLEAGIIDPAKVVISSIRNAVSVASTLLTTEAMIRKPSVAKPGDSRPQF